MLVFPSNHYMLWGPALLEIAELPRGNRELIPSFAPLVCATFAFPMKISLSQPTVFPAFTLPVFSLIPLLGERVSGCVAIDCWLGLSHNVCYSVLSL